MSERTEAEQFNKVLGKNIRKHRIAKTKKDGTRQIDIANYIGVKYQAVWMWEKGKVNISSYHLYKLAQCLEVGVLDLIPTKINNNGKKN
jgi:transcriptional regulator with XRE-family HTH domain